jgi:hypothetical protein
MCPARAAARSGAAQMREPGLYLNTGVPGLQRTIPLRSMLRCARDKNHTSISAYGRPVGFCTLNATL